MVYWHVCKWKACIPQDPLRILGNVWNSCIVAIQRCAGRLLRQLSWRWKILGLLQPKYEIRMWTDCSFPSEAMCCMSAQRGWALWEQTRVRGVGVCGSEVENEERVSTTWVLSCQGKSSQPVCLLMCVCVYPGPKHVCMFNITAYSLLLTVLPKSNDVISIYQYLEHAACHFYFPLLPSNPKQELSFVFSFILKNTDTVILDGKIEIKPRTH